MQWFFDRNLVDSYVASYHYFKHQLADFPLEIHVNRDVKPLIDECLLQNGHTFHI